MPRSRTFWKPGGLAGLAVLVFAGCVSRQPEVQVIYLPPDPTPTPAPTPRTVYVEAPAPRKAPVGIAPSSPEGFNAVTRPQSYSNP